MQGFVSLVFIVRIFWRGSQASPGVILNENDHKRSEGRWSSELTKRLDSHSCHAGNLHKDTTLLHGLKAGTFKELGRVKDVEVCVLQCCESHRCELALFMNNYCYGITCYSQQHCKTAPAFENNKDKTVTVFLYKKAKTNMASHLDQEINQSKKITTRDSPFVLYPADSDNSRELAFSVNLRRIATHYTDNKQMKKVLTEKADEHLVGNVTKVATKNVGDTDNSTLLKFLSKSESSSAHRRHGVIPGTQDKLRTKPHPKENNVNDIDWNPNLLKAAISSSCVAILIVGVVLLAMSRKKLSRGK